MALHSFAFHRLIFNCSQSLTKDLYLWRMSRLRAFIFSFRVQTRMQNERTRMCSNVSALFLIWARLVAVQAGLQQRRHDCVSVSHPCLACTHACCSFRNEMAEILAQLNNPKVFIIVSLWFNATCPKQKFCFSSLYTNG